MTKVTFIVQPREIKGKAVKKLRREQVLPANIHGSLKQPISVQVSEVPFQKLYDQVGDTGLVYLTVEGEQKARPVLIDQVELNPVTNQIQHVIFKQVNLKERITAMVPLEIVGEVDIPDSVLMTIRDEIEIEALPSDFPEKIEVDVSGLTEIGDSVLVQDLKLGSTEIAIVGFEELAEKPVIVIQAQQEEEEPEPVETEVGAEPAKSEAESGEASDEASSEEATEGETKE